LETLTLRCKGKIVYVGLEHIRFTFKNRRSKGLNMKANGRLRVGESFVIRFALASDTALDSEGISDIPVVMLFDDNLDPLHLIYAFSATSFAAAKLISFAAFFI